MKTTLALCGGLLLLAACTTDPDGDPDAVDDVAADTAPVLLPCAEPGTLFTRDNGEQDHALGAGGEVGVVLGFQGFIFTRLGVYSPYPLAQQVTVHTRASVDAAVPVDFTTTHSGIKTSLAPGGAWQTEPVWLFFNNNPLTDLIGHQATFTLRLPTETCELTVTLDVDMVSGGEMGSEGFVGCEPQCDPG